MRRRTEYRKVAGMREVSNDADANVVEMHTGMNPDFFKNTVVEDAVEKFKTESVTLTAE
jgi:hypothetical protein